MDSSNTLSPDELRAHFDKEIRRWFADRGDQTLRLDYPLTTESTVLDLGGYEGRWAEHIQSKHGCFVHVFEPVPEFCEGIRRRFDGNHRVAVHEFGLGPREEEVEFRVSADGTGAWSDGRPVAVRMLRASTVIEQLVFETGDIALAKINIEGGEYDLLDHLTETGVIEAIRNVQVQFHTFYPDCQARRGRIAEALSRTHERTWCYDFVWESWKKK